MSLGKVENEKLRVLLLEDVPTDAELIVRELRKGGFSFDFKRVETRPQFIEALDGFRPNLILSDYALPAFDGVSALELVQQDDRETPFIFVTGAMGEEWAIETLKSGATDYVLKDRLSRLVPAVHRALSEVEQRIERRRAQEALRESEERYRDLFENASDLIQSVTPNGRFQYVNRAWRETLGYTEEEVASLTLFDIIHPGSLDHCMRIFQRVLAGKEIGKVGAVFMTKDGEEIVVEGSVNCRFEEGKPTNTRGIFRDVTERVQAEAEREALIAELEARTAELEQFIFIVFHDLKNPLVTVGGYVGSLERDLGAGNYERAKGDLARISKATGKMRQLLSELAEYTRIGRLVNPPKEISLGELAREASMAVADQAALRGVELIIDPNLPTVYGDRPRLREVLENLLSNAAKFMGDQPSPRIEIGMRYEDTETVFYVRDNGIGIDPRYQGKIFDLFCKLDPRTEGIGVGLALTRRIVEVHGGRIWVESEGAEKGSTFCFTLPLADKGEMGSQRG